jgi:hypothetical protein
MKTLYALILVLLAGTAYGQSNLPACQGSDASKWSHCFGNWTTSNGYKYVGEWKDGKPNGYGTATYFKSNGDLSAFLARPIALGLAVVCALVWTWPLIAKLLFKPSNSQTA